MTWFPKKKKPKPWRISGKMQEARARYYAIKRGDVHLSPTERGSLREKEKKRLEDFISNNHEDLKRMVAEVRGFDDRDSVLIRIENHKTPTYEPTEEEIMEMAKKVMQN